MLHGCTWSTGGSKPSKATLQTYADICRHMQTYADSKVDGWEDRDDITVVVWDPMGHDGSAQLPQLKSPDRWCVEDVPQDCIGYVTGNRRAALGGIEEVPSP